MSTEVKTISFLSPVSRDEVHPLAAYRLFGNCGLRASRLILGAMSFGDKFAAFMGAVEKDEARAMYNKYCDLGGNFIDTACNYQFGQSEEWLGEFMKERGNRKEMIIATKYSAFQKRGDVNHAGNSRKNMHDTVNECLARLQTDYIDLFYIHFLDYSTPCEEVMRGLNDLVTRGKVLYLGVSDCPAWWVARCNTIAELRGWAKFVCYQGKYSLGDRDLEREVFQVCKEFSMSIVPWNVLGGGKWTGKYKRSENPDKKYEKEDAHRAWVTVDDRDLNIIDVINEIAKEQGVPASHVALMWCLSKGHFPMVGVRKLSQLEDNLEALKSWDTPSKRLTPAQIARLDEISKIDMGFPTNFLGGTKTTDIPWIKTAGVIIDE